MRMKKDWEFFKYYSLTRNFFTNLTRSQIYCASPTTFNDPFDCQVEWKGSLQRALSKGVDPDRRAKLQEILERFNRVDPVVDMNPGVACFTRDVRSVLMWSHYAQVHAGVCCLYRIPADYFPKKYKEPDSNGFFFVGGGKVRYGDDAFLNWLLKGSFNRPLKDDYVENAVVKILTTKAKNWRYEEEWRLVTSVPGALAFDPAFLREITFGLRTSDADKDQIRTIARGGNPKVKFNETAKDESADYVLLARPAR
jgi:hypothetical protein